MSDPYDQMTCEECGESFTRCEGTDDPAPLCVHCDRSPELEAERERTHTAADVLADMRRDSDDLAGEVAELRNAMSAARSLVRTVLDADAAAFAAGDFDAVLVESDAIDPRTLLTDAVDRLNRALGE